MSATTFRRPEGLPVLEAARMALSDCGYDPKAMSERNGVLQYTDDLPVEVAWRAACIAKPEYTRCLRCVSAQRGLGGTRRPAEIRAACLALLPFTFDCGVWGCES